MTTGELLGHLGGLSKEAMHLLVVVAYVHRGAYREHVARADEHGKPTSSTNESMSSWVVSSFQRGWSMPSWSSMAENLCRFSARSIDTGEVPRMGTWRRYSFMARLLGIWPPTLTITPRGDSRVDDVHHALKRQLVEVETVAHVVVGRYGLGIVS